MCNVVEDRAHVFKKCYYLQVSMALIKRLWGLHMSDHQLYAPSRLCIDHPLVSLTTM